MTFVTLGGAAAGFALARFFLGLGEAGNFPASIKTVAEWFPRKERAFATGIFNSGTNIGALLTPLMVPPLVAAVGLGGRLHRHRRPRLLLADLVVVLLRHARRPPQGDGRGAGAHPERPAGDDRPRCRGRRCVSTARRGPSRSASSSPIRSGGSTSSGSRTSSTATTGSIVKELGAPLVDDLSDHRRRQHRRRLAVVVLHQARLDDQRGAQGRRC